MTAQKYLCAGRALLRGGCVVCADVAAARRSDDDTRKVGNGAISQAPPSSSSGRPAPVGWSRHWEANCPSDKTPIQHVKAVIHCHVGRLGVAVFSRGMRPASKASHHCAFPGLYTIQCASRRLQARVYVKPDCCLPFQIPSVSINIAAAMTRAYEIGVQMPCKGELLRS